MPATSITSAYIPAPVSRVVPTAAAESEITANRGQVIQSVVYHRIAVSSRADYDAQAIAAVAINIVVYADAENVLDRILDGLGAREVFINLMKASWYHYLSTDVD